MTEGPTARPIPYRDPPGAFAVFAGDPVAAFLDSATETGPRGRYAYIAADPFRVITAAKGETTLDGSPVAGDPFRVLERQLKMFRMGSDPDLPPFQGGAVGYLGYELGRHLERLPPPLQTGLDIPELVIGLYDTIAAFDVQTRQAWIFAAELGAADKSLDRPSPEARAGAMADRIADAPPLAPVDWGPAGSWRPELSRRQYEDMVSRAIAYIHAGDIFQANLTQRLLAARPEGLSPFMLYRRLRALSPAPFGAYLAAGPGMAVASASPERFLNLSPGGHVSTRPIKGTRPRGRTPGEDAKLARDLIDSEKDQAENLMIVDLLRNDLSRVCRLGSVEVKELAGLESFANVHHLVSEVRGTLFPNKGAIDLLRATFPGGSVTGAPKIRAMEIINELEPARRGPYCGAIAWIGFDGAMDSAIVIRTLVIKDGEVAAQAGGGIVADSDPGAEYEEAMDKAWAMLQSLDPGEIAPGEIVKEQA
ncbi:MAG: aminodeoxychorismate synthase, component I [Rhodospirillaceae bacterium]|jgi:para-aminobenzoate synthetase component 1|nr:aminodeoxychorismate synthase, component I [Rhodospirillaceae bacterium]|tara:strand:+ start:13961 stop:15394 length:1434 start_codon:yes stop_codon:yes gene_type:complete